MIRNPVYLQLSVVINYEVLTAKHLGCPEFACCNLSCDLKKSLVLHLLPQHSAILTITSRTGRVHIYIYMYIGALG